MNTGLTAVKLHLAQAPGAQRVGLVIIEGVPQWGDMEDDQSDMVIAALDSAIPGTNNWDVDWLDLDLGINFTARCLAIYAESTEAGQVIRTILKLVDVEEGAFAVGGVWDAVGRAIPVHLQTAGVRDEREEEWAHRACLYTLDTTFRSWSARRAVIVLLQSGAEADTTWQGLKRRFVGCKAAELGAQG